MSKTKIKQSEWYYCPVCGDIDSDIGGLCCVNNHEMENMIFVGEGKSGQLVADNLSRAFYRTELAAKHRVNERVKLFLSELNIVELVTDKLLKELVD